MTIIPALPRWLGLSGLLPQAACLFAVIVGGGEWRWFALATGWGYAALIFSFLGGMWWGVAAGLDNRGGRVPGWIWIVSVLPSLVALATFIPWIVGDPWPGPSLIVLGVAIIASLLADWRLQEHVPGWWMRLRIPLSLGLGGMTVLLGLA